MATKTQAAKGRVKAAEVARRHALSEVLAERWWAVGLRGIVAIAFGLMSVLALIDMKEPKEIMPLALMLAAYLLVDGVLAIISAIRAAPNGERWRVLILQGVITLVAGVGVVLAMLFAPSTLRLIGVFALTLMVWPLVTGVLMLRAALTLNLDYGRRWLALAGVASLVLGLFWGLVLILGGIALQTEMPGLKIPSSELGTLAAYWSVFGVSLVALAFQLHARNTAGA